MDENPKARPYKSAIAELAVEYAVAALFLVVVVGFIGLAAKVWLWVLFP